MAHYPQSKYPDAPSIPDESPPPYSTEASKYPYAPPQDPNYNASEHPEAAPQPPPPYGPAQPNQSRPQIMTPMQHNAPQCVVISAPTFGDAPVHMKCFKCQSIITTSTEHKIGGAAIISCVVIFLIGALLFLPLLLGCYFIPFCISGMKDVEHRCPSCHQLLGKYSRLS